MMRCLTRLVPLGGLLAAAVLVLSATPTGATIVCSPGHTPPPGGGTGPYCKNVKPKAVTLSATHVGGKSAKLNGLAGAGVAGGDPTEFFFQYGTTMAYGKDTPTTTLGSCPPGIPALRARTAPPLPVRRCRQSSWAAALHDVPFQARRQEFRRQDQGLRQELQDEVRRSDRARRVPKEGGARTALQRERRAQRSRHCDDLPCASWPSREPDPNRLPQRGQVHAPDHGSQSERPVRPGCRGEGQLRQPNRRSAAAGDRQWPRTRTRAWTWTRTRTRPWSSSPPSLGVRVERRKPLKTLRGPAGVSRLALFRPPGSCVLADLSVGSDRLRAPTARSAPRYSGVDRDPIGGRAEPCFMS